MRLENRDRVMVGAMSKIRTLGKSQVPSRQKTGLGSVGETGANEGRSKRRGERGRALTGQGFSDALKKGVPLCK